MWRIAAVLTGVAATAAALSGCGSGDSTASKTPEPTIVATPEPQLPPPSAGTDPDNPAPPPDPCLVNLAAPEILRAVAELPNDPRSGQGWSSEPLAGNYNECAPLSAVVVEANTNAANPSTRVIMFHHGKLIGNGVPDPVGFNGLDIAASTADTVALTYSSGVPGLDSVVRFRWNGNGVELVPNTG